MKETDYENLSPLSWFRQSDSYREWQACMEEMHKMHWRRIASKARKLAAGAR